MKSQLHGQEDKLWGLVALTFTVLVSWNFNSSENGNRNYMSGYYDVSQNPHTPNPWWHAARFDSKKGKLCIMASFTVQCWWGFFFLFFRWIKFHTIHFWQKSFSNDEWRIDEKTANHFPTVTLFTNRVQRLNQQP